MNVKESGVVPAVIVGLILSLVNIWWPRSDDRNTATATSLATLTERVSTLTTQVSELAKQPYIRRDEFANLENRITNIESRISSFEDRISGLHQRVGELERSERSGRQR